MVRGIWFLEYMGLVVILLLPCRLKAGRECQLTVTQKRARSVSLVAAHPDSALNSMISTP
jgi:hypothetical protein